MPVEIVEYQKNYHEYVRHICFETGFAGRSLEGIIDNKNLFLDLSTHYFLDANYGVTFIAKNNEKPAGYIFVSTNKRQYDRFQKEYYIKRLAIEIFSFHYFSGRDFKYYLALVASYLKGDFESPGMPDYPALIHINTDPSYHGIGIGKMMMNKAFEYLGVKNCPGVQLRTTSLNVNALAFFQKMGFTKLYSRPASFYNKYGFKDAENLIFGKKLD